jgi:hypothetical protein
VRSPQIFLSRVVCISFNLIQLACICCGITILHSMMTLTVVHLSKIFPLYLFTSDREVANYTTSTVSFGLLQSCFTGWANSTQWRKQLSPSLLLTVTFNPSHATNQNAIQTTENGFIVRIVRKSRYRLQPKLSKVKETTIYSNEKPTLILVFSSICNENLRLLAKVVLYPQHFVQGIKINTFER